MIEKLAIIWVLTFQESLKVDIQAKTLGDGTSRAFGFVI